MNHTFTHHEYTYTHTCTHTTFLTFCIVYESKDALSRCCTEQVAVLITLSGDHLIDNERDWLDILRTAEFHPDDVVSQRVTHWRKRYIKCMNNMPYLQNMSCFYLFYYCLSSLNTNICIVFCISYLHVYHVIFTHNYYTEHCICMIVNAALIL